MHGAPLLPSRPGPFERTLRLAAAWSVMALVSFEALAGAVSIVQELTRSPLERHLKALRSTPEDLIRASLGRDFEMWQALHQHVPADTQVLLARSIEGPKVKVLLTKLWALSYPITFRARPYTPGRPNYDPASPTDWRGYLLELGPAADFSEIPGGRELARGERFRLAFLEGSAK